MRISPLLTFALLPTLFGCDDTDLGTWVDKGNYQVPSELQESCKGMSLGAGDDVGYGNYSDSTASSGSQLECSHHESFADSVYLSDVDFAGKDTVPKSVNIDLAGVTGIKTPATSGTVPVGMDWGADYAPSSGATSISGTWEGFLSEVTSGGSAADTSTYDPYFYLSLAGVSEMTGSEGGTPEWTKPGFTHLVARLVEGVDGQDHFMVEAETEESQFAIGAPMEWVSPNHFVVDHHGTIIRRASADGFVDQGVMTLKIHELDAFSGEALVDISNFTLTLFSDQ